MKNDSIANMVFTLTQSYKHAIRSELKAKTLGLNGMHVKCFSYIKQAKTCTANDIVNHLHRDKAQVARIIKEMIEKQWIIKSNNPRDKRSQLLSLTTEGDQLAELIVQKQQEIQLKMVGGLTQAEIDMFHSITSKISNNLQRD